MVQSHVYLRDETNMRLLTGQSHNACGVAVFFYSLANFSLHIEVANNLPFARFYNACIQIHYVHTSCNSGKGGVWPFEDEKIKLMSS